MHGYPRITFDSRCGREHRLVLKAVRSNKFVERNDLFTIRAFDMEFPSVLHVVSFNFGDARFILDVVVKSIVIRIRPEMSLQVGCRWTDGRGFEIISLGHHLSGYNGQNTFVDVWEVTHGELGHNSQLFHAW